MDTAAVIRANEAAAVGNEPCRDANTAQDGLRSFLLNAVDRAYSFVITSPRARNKAVALHGVKGLRIGWSPAAAGANLARARVTKVCWAELRPIENGAPDPARKALSLKGEGSGLTMNAEAFAKNLLTTLPVTDDIGSAS